MRKSVRVLVVGLTLMLLWSGMVQAGRAMPTLATPEGQTLVIIGEAEDRSEALSRGDEMGFTSQAPFRALHEIEKQRSSGLFMLEAGLDLNGPNKDLNWPAGQWLQFTLTSGEEIRAVHIFASGPKMDMNVYPLGLKGVRMSHDQLHANNRSGVKFFPTLFYVGIPASVQRNGRKYGIGMSDIAGVHLIHVPPDSLTAILERR